MVHFEVIFLAIFIKHNVLKHNFSNLQINFITFQSAVLLSITACLFDSVIFKQSFRFYTLMAHMKRPL